METSVPFFLSLNWKQVCILIYIDDSDYIFNIDKDDEC